MKIKFIIIIALVMSICSVCYAKQPRALIDKDTGKILSWGYTDFEEKNNMKVIEDIYLKEDEKIDEGLRYDNGRIVKDSSLKIIPKTEKDKILETIGLSESDIAKVKAIKD